MEIKINREINDNLLEIHKIRWDLSFKKSLVYFTFYAIAGLFVMGLAALGAEKSGHFWGILSSFGLSLIFLSLYYFSHNYQNKRKHLANVRMALALSKQQAQNNEIVVNDNGVTFKDFQTYSEWKWSAFSCYMLYQDYLFLLMGSSVLNSIAIQKAELSVDQFAELINFCKGRLYLKK
jgi:hypothetical protein